MSYDHVGASSTWMRKFFGTKCKLYFQMQYCHNYNAVEGTLSELWSALSISPSEL